MKINFTLGDRPVRDGYGGFYLKHLTMEQKESPPLEQHLAVVLETILEDKEQRCVAPVCADMQEIMAVVNQDVKDTLNSMVKRGLLTFHRTLNSTTFELAPPK